MKKQHTKLVENVLRASLFHMDCLEIVRDLSLPDWAIGAGFVRNLIWDHLHDFESMTPLADVDVLFFDTTKTSPENDATLEEKLFEHAPEIPWSVRNQARMHIRNNDNPYSSTEDALRYWLETPTCVAIRLERDDRLTVLTPYGLDDLINMRGRPTPAGERRHDQYVDRMRKKDWPAIWPKVKVEYPTTGGLDRKF